MGLRMRTSRLIPLLTALALLSGLGQTPARADDLERELQRLQQQQGTIREEMAEKQSQLRVLQERAQEAQEAYHATLAELEQARTALQRAVQERVIAEARLRAYKAELEQVEAELRQQEQALANRVRALYMDGRVEYLDVLFGSTSFSDFLARFDLLQSVVRQDARLVSDVRLARRQAAAKRAEAEALYERAAALEEEVRRQTELAELKEQEAAGQLQEVEARTRELRAALDDFERRNQMVEAEIQRLQEEIARRRQGKLVMRFPLGHVRVTDDYGMRWHPILGERRMHYGVDFAASMREPVYAVESGRVVMAEWYGAYGYAVLIYHGDVDGHSISTLYGHNDELLVRPGQEVAKGQVIAWAGSTGWSTGPHVHFEVRRDGEAINPWDYLPSRP